MEARPSEALRAAHISQNWKKTSERNCSEIIQKVARNTRSCQKLPSNLWKALGKRGEGWEATQ